MAHDPVNHPSHYTNHPSGVECITVTRHMSFNLGNVVKYLWRAGLKDHAPTLQDLRKARWYLADEIMKLEQVEAANALKIFDDAPVVEACKVIHGSGCNVHYGRECSCIPGVQACIPGVRA